MTDELIPSSEHGMHDPKGKHHWPMLPGVWGHAKYSDDLVARYWLSRQWTDAPQKHVLWIGMNPSTASAFVDDPTVRKEQAFSRRLGFAYMIKCNVCAIRATFPNDLAHTKSEVRARHRVLNKEHTLPWLGSAAMIVCAWGQVPATIRNELHDMLALLKGREVWCFGTTKHGHPRHPLYLPLDAQPVRWKET